MQRFFPITIGILTIALFGGIGLVFWTEGRTYWGAFFFGLTALRSAVWISQLIKLTQSAPEED